MKNTVKNRSQAEAEHSQDLPAGNGRRPRPKSDVRKENEGSFELIKSIFGSVRQPLVLLDEQLKVRFANRAFYETFRLDPARVEGALFFQLGNREWDTPELGAALGRVLLDNAQFENFAVTRYFDDAGEKTLSLTARKLQHKSETILLTIEDVTQQKKTAAALRTSELKYRRLFETAKDGIIILDALSGRVFDSNPYFEQMSGYSREELLGKELWEIGFSQNPNASRAMLGELRSSGKARFDNLTLRAANGQLIQVELLSNAYLVDGLRIIQCNVRDISARKRAEEALRLSEKRFRSLAEGIPQLVWTCTPEGYCDYISRQWSEYTGIPAQEQLGHGWTSAVHPEDRDAIGQLWIEATGRGEPFELEYRLRRFDGQYRWFKVTGVPITDNAGVITKWFGTCTDIQVQKDTESALERARQLVVSHAAELEREVAARTERLRQINAELEAFSYSVSHDLRSPLRAMRGYARALLEDYADDLDDLAKRYLSRIEHGAERLDHLVQNILTYTRIARTELELGPVRLEPLLQEIIEDSPAFQEPNAEVVLRKPLPPVIGNEASLTQCFSNLLGNAIKFVRKGVKPRVEIWAEAVGSEVCINVKDNGIGIDPAHHADIFQIFGRVHPEHAFEGTGIGLAIVKKAVERMGGTLGLDSKPGEGSRFWIQLPRAPSTV